MALRAQARVIGALIIRDALARFGRENIGFFWVIGEPMLLTTGVIIMWSMTNHAMGRNVDVVPFILTGYSMLTLWRHLVFRSIHVIRRNVGLLFHRNVRPLDVLIAQTILEVVSVHASFWCAYVPLLLLGFVDTMRDPLQFVGGWLLMAWFGFSFATIIAGLSEMSETVERLLQPIMYITIPLTGTFFMVDWLPDSAQRAVAWSPLVNISEMYRGGLFSEEVPTHWDATYVLIFCVVQTAIGLPLLKAAQSHVRME